MIEEEFKKHIVDDNLKKCYDAVLCKNEYIEPMFDFEYYKLNHNKDLPWRCKKCGKEFTAKRTPCEKFLSRCEDCYPKSGASVGEKEVYDFIKSICNDEIIQKDRTVLKEINKELDIYIPSRKLAIEFNGLYWHSEQHISDSNYHLKKTIECEKQGIHLIHLFEDEWEYKKDIVKSRLKNLFGVYDNIVYARKCEIGQIDYKTSMAFLQDNHLQSAVNSKYNLGLFYNDELVSLMTFGNYRTNMGRKSVENEYELVRFCNRLGYHIPGAASKLLKHFERKFNPNVLISYADRRWSQGNLYKQLGFEFIRNCSPSYFYVVEGIRRNRFRYRKSELSKLLEWFDPNLSEEKNMNINGYHKVFDCGSMLFEKRFSILEK